MLLPSMFITSSQERKVRDGGLQSADAEPGTLAWRIYNETFLYRQTLFFAADIKFMSILGPQHAFLGGGLYLSYCFTAVIQFWRLYLGLWLGVFAIQGVRQYAAPPGLLPMSLLIRPY
jgi:hypothetical protein